MTLSTLTPHESGMHEVDRALALLAAVEPRAGLEQRVHARLAAAPHRLAPAHWMLTTASVMVVVSAVTLGVHHERTAAPLPPTFFATRVPRPSQQAAAAAAAVAAPSHPLPHRQTRHRAFRAQHERSILPRGTVAPRHPQLALPAPQQ